jgi:ribosome-binding factor A
MAPTQRQLEVQGLLKAEISAIIRDTLQDPLIGFVTVTDARVSVDLRYADIYVSVLGDDQAQADTMRALRRAARFVRGQLGRRAVLKYTPEVRFHFDATAERAARIEGILRELDIPKDDEPDADTDSSGD